ncbi:hypothetical protein PBI_SWITZER_71 [Mycobacterium phage Switzer]|nr:hypothetical protein FDI12_gp71 [Mycobacterium phage Switzer]AEK10370.1 hypothetical protein PBI_SWITZER_71 [Mycobacterium phage Switzer]
MQQGGSPKVSRAQAVQLVDLVHEYYCPNLDLET